MLFIKLFKESFLFATHALVSNKLRTFLSLLGISIGIFAIISVFTVVDALEANVRGSVASLGSNVIYVQKWPWAFGGDYPWWKYMNRPQPSVSDMEMLSRNIHGAEALAFIASVGGKTVKYRNNSVENASFTGASYELNKIKSFELKEGRYFTQTESVSGRPVGVIGADISESLFPGGNAVGQEVTVMGRKIQVIGVFKKEGSSLIDNSSDSEVLVPLNFIRGLIDLRSDRTGPFIQAKAKAHVSNEELIDELRGLMRSIHKLKPREDDDFALNQSSLLSASLDGLFSILEKAGWIIGGFSILVGGFGIANIMFVSVRERTNIIGIQKSLGAKNYFILLQFLVEAIMLCLFGGLIGLTIVFLGTLLTGAVSDFDISLTQGNIALGLFVSAIIGIISGFMPAYSASQMDPVEAIRSN